MKRKKNDVTETEREALKKEVQLINKRLPTSEISKEEAQEFKKEAAEKNAKKY